MGRCSSAWLLRTRVGLLAERRQHALSSPIPHARFSSPSLSLSLCVYLPSLPPSLPLLHPPRSLACGGLGGRVREEQAAELLGARGWERHYQQNRAKICSFWMAGQCTRGLACPFRHEKPTYYEARDMGLIKGVKGSNADRMIIQRYYGDKDVVANSMLREVSKREPALLDKAEWPSTRKGKAKQRAIGARGIAKDKTPKVKLAGAFEPGKPATMVAAWSTEQGTPDREALRKLLAASGEVTRQRLLRLRCC